MLHNAKWQRVLAPLYRTQLAIDSGSVTISGDSGSREETALYVPALSDPPGQTVA